MRKLIIFLLVLSIVLVGCTKRTDEGNINMEDTTDINKDDVNNGDVNEGSNTAKEDTQEDLESEDELEDSIDIAIGLEAPDFTLTNLKGKEVSLSDYRGKMVFLNFWASWCQWCDLEMPDLNKIAHDYSDDLVVLGINVMEDEDTVRDYIEEGGYDFEVLLDKEGIVGSAYYVYGLPSSYFIDKDGILQFAYQSMMTYEQMAAVVDAIIDYHESN